MNQSNNKINRRIVAYVSVLGTTQLHLRSPWIIALWSVTFPGLGHLLLSKYLRGYLLFLWEVFINYKAKVNLLILYSFIGDFERAKAVVDIEWLLLYIPTYIFAIWDSYRTAVDLNHNYILAAREDGAIQTFKLSSLEINYLDKRKPWVAAAWSMLVPGAGQLYIHRIVTAVFVVCWWIIVAYYSKIVSAYHYTFLGDFEKAKAVVDMQWFLNVSSVYFFSIYDAFINTIENNKLYEWELGKFLKRHYQPPHFKMPSSVNIGEHMYVISTFEHSIYLELALTALQMKGINKESILAVPMDKRAEDRTLFDSIHGSDGISMLDIPALLAVFFGIFGSIYGFVLEWGPLFWGLIGIITGFIIGLIIKLLTTKKFKRQTHLRNTEIVLIIQCHEHQVEVIKSTLWEHHAFGVRKLDLESQLELSK